MNTHNSLKPVLDIDNTDLDVNFKYIIFPLLSIILFMLGSSYFTSYISLKFALIGATQFEIGCIHSAFYAGMLFGAAMLGSLIQHLGHMRSYTLLACIAAISLIIQGFNYDLLLWISMRFVFGICLSGIYIVIESWILANSTIATRGSVLSVYMIALYSSQVLSHEFLNLINFLSWWPYAIASLFCFLSLIPVVISIPNNNTTHNPKIKYFNVISKCSRFDLASCLLSGFIISAMLSFIPNFANYQHYSVATLMQITIAGGCLLQLPIVKFSYYIGGRIMLMTTCIVTCISALAIWAFYLQAPVVYLFSFLLGGFGFTLYTLSIVNICVQINPTDMVNANADLLLLYCIGSILGPILASFFMDCLSIHWLYAYLAIVAGFLTLIGVYPQKNH